MKRITMVCAVTSLLSMTACTTPSIEPFYTDKNLVADSHLPGLWQNNDREETIRINADGTVYEFKYLQQGGAVALFTAALFELHGQRYLDLYPRDRLVKPMDLLELPYVPAHLLLRVAREKDHLRMSILDQDWMADKLAKDCSPRHSVTSRGAVLTGPTDQIQAFLATHGDDPAAFMYWSEWQRSADSAGN